MFRLKEIRAFGFLGMKLVERESIRERGHHRGQDLGEAGGDPEYNHGTKAGHSQPASCPTNLSCWAKENKMRNSKVLGRLEEDSPGSTRSHVSL